MNTKTLICLLAAFTLLLAVSAQAAARWDSFEPYADCDGWALVGGVKIGSSHPFIDLTYDVTLSQSGAVVEERTGFFRIWMDADVVPIDEFKTWDTLLDGTGEYDVAGVFTVPYTSDGDSLRTFTQTIDCGGGTEICAKRPGWWKRHGDQWPVDSLEIAGGSYSKEEVIAFMHVPARKLQIRLARHLIAAKLNVAAGVDNSVQDNIEAGDAFLAEHGFCSWLRRSERREGRAIKNLLRQFNRQGCPGKSLPLATEADEDDYIDNDDLYGWGEVKSMYR
jgi:hypothetical protein